MDELKNEQVNETSARSKKKSKLYLLLFIGAAVLLLVAGGFFLNTYLDGWRAEKEMEGFVEQWYQQISQATPRPSEVPEVTPTPGREELEEIDPSWGNQTPKPIKIEDVIGILEMRNKKIPVLRGSTAEMLKASIGRFAGYGLNDPGDVLLIGHNYASGAQFGSLKKLKKGDQVKLTDAQNRTMAYEVYDIQAIKPDEVEKTATGLPQGLVLITCTKQGTERLVLKCKPVQ